MGLSSASVKHTRIHACPPLKLSPTGYLTLSCSTPWILPHIMLELVQVVGTCLLLCYFVSSRLGLNFQGAERLPLCSILFCDGGKCAREGYNCLRDVVVKRMGDLEKLAYHSCSLKFCLANCCNLFA